MKQDKTTMYPMAFRVMAIIFGVLYLLGTLVPTIGWVKYIGVLFGLIAMGVLAFSGRKKQ